jgi:alkaline phosphatase
MFENNQKIVLKSSEVEILLQNYKKGSDGLYNPGSLPFLPLAEMQSAYTSIQWAGSNHSADYVELAVFGPGSENLNGFVKNYQLHNFMLEATGADNSLLV